MSLKRLKRLCVSQSTSTKTSFVCRFCFRMKCNVADGRQISDNNVSLTVTFMTTHNPVSHQFKLMMNKTLFYTKNISIQTTHTTETSLTFTKISKKLYYGKTHLCIVQNWCRDHLLKREEARLHSKKKITKAKCNKQPARNCNHKAEKQKTRLTVRNL